MSKREYILAFDQGTTSSRTVVFDMFGAIRGSAQQSIEQILPRPGWVEHDPREIWESQRATAVTALRNAGITVDQVAAIGITNQRETVIVWDRDTGRPVYNAIVWQDRRTAGMTDRLRSAGTTDMIRQRTGLLADPYFSASKLQWLLDNVDGVRRQAESGRLALGTVDSWLLYNLSGGRVHVTDVTNACRTMLFDIRSGTWDDELLALFGVPRCMLPEIVACSGVVGESDVSILGKPVPIAGLAGDQQAALFGQQCTKPGMGKNTYGTGCFLLVHTGREPVVSESGLLTTVACQLQGRPLEYALEGSVFIGGAAIQWLRDGLGIIAGASEVNDLAGSVASSEGVYVVPAFVGLGAPYWDPSARGLIIGITRGTTAAHVAYATLESIAFQVTDVLRAMERDTCTSIERLRVDGGAAASDLLLQLQADQLGISVERPTIIETTALGVARLAGIGVGLWPEPGADDMAPALDRVFHAVTTSRQRENALRGWHRAVERARAWATDESGDGQR